jgi:CDP-diacylglycerol--glycerol-3-phosphate 3-phosphatidyltransferase
MSLFRRSRLPNWITVGRIVMAPAVFFLILAPGFMPRLLAFVLFVAAALSDLWDGYLARKHGWISDFGKLMDPLADKLLLVATFIPFYLLSHAPGGNNLPYWKVLPLWVVLVIFGREALITIMRAAAARRGVVIPAGTAGKYKAVAQNIFSGATIFWYALHAAALRHGWHGTGWQAWKVFHGTVLALSLLVAVVLTIFSFAVYLWNWRAMAREAR